MIKVEKAAIDHILGKLCVSEGLTDINGRDISAISDVMNKM